MTAEPTASGDSDSTGSAEDSFAVLELFGMKLSVKNPRLAEVLTTELGAKSKEHVSGTDEAANISRLQAEVAQAVPDLVLSPQLPRDIEESRARADLRARVDSAATSLGFIVQPDGIWESPTGVRICTRTAERPVTLAAAAGLVETLASLAQELGGEECVALFVVEDQENADVFRVAIRQRHAYDRIRTVTVANLEFIRSLLTARVLDHSGAVVLLAPVAEIDVGEILSIVRTAASEDVR